MRSEARNKENVIFFVPIWTERQPPPALPVGSGGARAKTLGAASRGLGEAHPAALGTTTT